MIEVNDRILVTTVISDTECERTSIARMEFEVEQRRAALDELLSTTFNSVLNVEEKALHNRLTEGLTISEIHTLVAVGLHEANPMGVVAARLGVTLATLTSAINKLVAKGLVKRTRSEEDRRKVYVELTKRGRQVYRAHGLFHRRMIEQALVGLTEQEEAVLGTALIKVKAFFDEQAKQVGMQVPPAPARGTRVTAQGIAPDQTGEKHGNA